MGEIVAAFGVCHSPHLLTRPPDENPVHQELSILAMHQLGKILDETKPDFWESNALRNDEVPTRGCASPSRQREGARP